MIVPVILGGGIGSRLWPLSRSAYPKQYNTFFEGDSLFQMSLLRARHFSKHVLIIAGEDHRFLILEQAAQKNIQPQILLEPARRDTGPAMALVAHYLQTQNDPLMLVMPADHVVQDDEAFYKAVEKATPLAEQGYLVTFGCQPEYASTAYGYIQRGELCSEGVYHVQAFIEKPESDRAKMFLASEDYHWNAGIFLCRASALLSELAQHAKAIDQCTRAAAESIHVDGAFLRPRISAFESCPTKSIDYALMEKTQKAVVVPVSMGWSDVGSWEALHDHLPKDAQGNTFSGDVVAKNVEDTYIRSTNRMVMGLGLRDLVVVETRDAVLVADKSHSQLIKGCIKELKQAGRSEVDVHARVYRPWGFYETLELGERYQVKHIGVKPGASLSLQMHDHRSEHWVVLSGHGEVTRGEDVFILDSDHSTYIPTKTQHRLRNLGEEELEIIEVQVGDYLGEDDIHRYEDEYGRMTE